VVISPFWPETQVSIKAKDIRTIHRAIQFSGVLAWLYPAIHVYAPENVDARVNPRIKSEDEHDGLEVNDPGPFRPSLKMPLRHA
jgi:hypothetical protein